MTVGLEIDRTNSYNPGSPYGGSIVRYHSVFRILYKNEYFHYISFISNVV